MKLRKYNNLHRNVCPTKEPVKVLWWVDVDAFGLEQLPKWIMCCLRPTEEKVINVDCQKQSCLLDPR